jgi:hypothetical protein
MLAIVLAVALAAPSVAPLSFEGRPVRAFTPISVYDLPVDEPAVVGVTDGLVTSIEGDNVTVGKGVFMNELAGISIMQHTKDLEAQNESLKASVVDFSVPKIVVGIILLLGAGFGGGYLFAKKLAP